MATLISYTFIQVLISGVLLGGIYALISIGLTLIFGVIKVINFAHGEFLMLAMYFAYWMWHYWGVDPYASVIVLAALLFLIGAATQRGIIQPLLRSPASMQIFATVGLSITLQNVALFLWKADYRTIQTAYQASKITIGELAIGYPRLVAFVGATAMTIIIFWFLKNTFTGRAIRAIAQDRMAAMLVGVNQKRMYMLAFGLGSACVGVAGGLLMPIYYVFPTVGTYFSLTAFVVVVLGGMGDIRGAWIGGIIIGLVEAISGFYVPALKEAVYFAIFILILLFRPSGILGLGRGFEEVAQE